MIKNKIHLLTILAPMLTVLVCCGTSKKQKVESTFVLSSLSTTVAVGNTLEITATMTYEDGSSDDRTAASTFYSSDSAIAKFTSAGTLTGLKTGSVTVNALYGQAASTALTITVGGSGVPDVTALTADNSVAGQITLSWTSGGGSTASYEYSYLAGTTAPADCSSANGTSVTTTGAVTGLTSGADYSFRVCTLDGSGNSSSGATVTATVR